MLPFRPCAAVLAVILGFAGGLAVASARATAITAEVWQGQYVCGQGLTDLTLTLVAAPTGQVQALFEFYADPRNSGVPRGCFEMSGNLDRSGHITLAPGDWRLQPLGYVSVGITGDIRAGLFQGQVEGPGCGSFALKRVFDPGVAETGCDGANS